MKVFFPTPLIKLPGTPNKIPLPQVLQPITQNIIDCALRGIDNFGYIDELVQEGNDILRNTVNLLNPLLDKSFYLSDFYQLETKPIPQIRAYVIPSAVNYYKALSLDKTNPQNPFFLISQDITAIINYAKDILILKRTLGLIDSGDASTLYQTANDNFTKIAKIALLLETLFNPDQEVYHSIKTIRIEVDEETGTPPTLVK